MLNSDHLLNVFFFIRTCLGCAICERIEFEKANIIIVNRASCTSVSRYIYLWVGIICHIASRCPMPYIFGFSTIVCHVEWALNVQWDSNHGHRQAILYLAFLPFQYLPLFWILGSLFFDCLSSRICDQKG